MQITNIKTKTEEIVIFFLGMKRIIRKYYKQPYANKFDNLKVLEQFLENHKLQLKTS